MTGGTTLDFLERYHEPEEKRSGDLRSPYQRDRARIIHSAAFRRLQGKTQVMGVGEGDFHRTRLTHSIECAQIGNGLLDVLRHGSKIPSSFEGWLPDRDLVEAACFAHDLGHPPFGHGGEKALHRQMHSSGGFEGNAQTLRIICRLEKHKTKGSGINPTRRLVLAVLKYPIPYSYFETKRFTREPPKCYYDEETRIVEWATRHFSDAEREQLLQRNDKDKAKYRTFDSGLMELADDIAYGVHDIEDIVARRLVDVVHLREEICSAFSSIGEAIRDDVGIIGSQDICDRLYAGSFERKQVISRLVNLFITAVQVHKVHSFQHPLLSHCVGLPAELRELLTKLKKLALKLVVQKAEVQQLEQRGQRVVQRIFEALKDDPEALIPKSSWDDLTLGEGTEIRRVCDYVAGMTDSYAEKVYRRLFIPGYGSSSDEL